MIEQQDDVSTTVGEDTRLATLFSSSVATAQARPRQWDRALFPEELADIDRAIPRRRAEYASVRVCARRALSQIGVAPAPLPSLPDRSPRWPPGVVGSMTHTSGYCAAVVASKSVLRGLGIDAEREMQMEPELVQMVCTTREREVLARRRTGLWDAVVYFSAKEAFYKCQYPLTRTFLDFSAVELKLDFASGTFQTQLVNSALGMPGWINRTKGRFFRHDGLVLCGVELALES